MADHNDPNPNDPNWDDQHRRDENRPPENPFEALFGAFGMGGGMPGSTPGAGQPDLQGMMQQVQGMLQQMGMGGLFGMPGGGNADQARWEQIRDVARKVVASSGSDPSPGQDRLNAVRDAVRLADTWLDNATGFASPGGQPEVWSRAEWVENSMSTWRRLIDPVATSMSSAMADSVAPEGGEPSPDQAFAGLEAMLRPWLKSSGSTIFGLQAGQAIGALAADVVSATDTGLPLDGNSRGRIALVPTNIDAFSEGLQVPDRDVLLYLCLRESARQRLYASAGWLGPQILALVEQYAAGITIDLSGVEDAVANLDMQAMTPQTMQELSEKLQGNLFEPKQTPAQQAVLERLETLLALVEGWVDEVVGQAVATWMPNAGALAEAVRRRRATGGPTEAAFKALVGLEIRPRRLRDAANLWAALRDARGAEGRDAVWSHPDLAPTARDLDDPLGFVAGDERQAEAGTGERDDLDAELEQLLSQAGQDHQAGDPDRDADRGDDGGSDGRAPGKGGPDDGGPETGGTDDDGGTTGKPAF